MPMVELTVPAGSLTEQGRAGIQHALARTLLKWEGAPDNNTFHSVSWSYLHELPPGALVTLSDEEPRFRVDIRVPVGALSERRKAGVVEEMTQLVLDAAGLGPEHGGRVWVLVHEQPEGTWGSGGRIISISDLRAMAQRSATGS